MWVSAYSKYLQNALKSSLSSKSLMSLFRIFIGWWVIWKKVIILEHFGDIWGKLPRWPSSTTIGQHWRGIIDWCSYHDIDRQRSAQKDCLVSSDLEPKFSPIYKITLDELYPNYISFANMLEAKCALLFYYFQQQRFSRICSRLKRRSKEICDWNSIDINLFIYAVFIHYYCYELLNHVWIVFFVRFMV